MIARTFLGGVTRNVLLAIALLAVCLGAGGCFNFNVKVDKDAVDVPGYKWRAPDKAGEEKN